MEFKGTKGKWYVDTENGSNNIISSEQSIGIKSEVDDLTWYICAVWTDCGFDDKESKANALLISKAREMLEMLEKLVNTYELLGLSNEVKQLIKEATEI